MAKQLFKLVMTAETSTVAKPTTTRLFYKTESVVGTGLTIVSSKFWDDDGTLLASNSITQQTASNGYYLLFVDGVLQQSSTYTITSAQVTISAGGDTMDIPVSAPITLAVTNFAPVSSTIVTG
ncbi:MAG: DUF4183 domain-containing protein [Oscillospiraceae bacterium]|jgi:hypothetical protein